MILKSAALLVFVFFCAVFAGEIFRFADHFVERPVRDGVASPGAFVVYLYRGRPLQRGKILASADVHNCGSQTDGISSNNCYI